MDKTRSDSTCRLSCLYSCSKDAFGPPQTDLASAEECVILNHTVCYFVDPIPEQLAYSYSEKIYGKLVCWSIMPYHDNEIIRADARDLDRYVRPNSVTLTVTSPPYRNAIDYSQHVDNMIKSENVWMRGTGEETTGAYLDMMQDIFDQVRKATVDGGFCCIVIGDEVVSGKLIPLPSLLLSRLAGYENDDDHSKWRLRDVIIWHKVTSGRNGAGNRFGIFIKYPYPGYFRANIMHECILVLQKGATPKTSRGDDPIPVNRVVKREIANSIWNIPPVPPGSIKHPVPFPEQIPWRLITLLTRSGDLVLDPMNGSGQTTKIAHMLGRRYLGLDIRDEYVNEARERLTEMPKVGSYLLPVYHRESWSNSAQGGFFETVEADLSKNIPGSYRILFWTNSAADTSGELYLYYVNECDSHLCFIMGDKVQYRLNLGSIEEKGSMLRLALESTYGCQFTCTSLNRSLASRLVKGRRPAQACITLLKHLGYVQAAPDQDRYYELTPKGRSLQSSYAASEHE